MLGESTEAAAVAAAAAETAGPGAEPRQERCSRYRRNTLPQDWEPGGRGSTQRTPPEAPRHAFPLRFPLPLRARLVALWALFLPTLALDHPGDLDPHFGTGGKTV